MVVPLEWLLLLIFGFVLASQRRSSMLYPHSNFVGGACLSPMRPAVWLTD
jgi:hypothetical protein